MEWIELIRMGGQTAPEKTPLPEVLGELVLQADAPGLLAHSVCASVNGRELLLILKWSCPVPPKEGRSHLGRIAAAEMGRFGLVDHSVWRLLNNTNNDA